jgi:hypothetical protein
MGITPAHIFLGLPPSNMVESYASLLDYHLLMISRAFTS